MIDRRHFSKLAAAGVGTAAVTGNLLGSRSSRREIETDSARNNLTDWLQWGGPDRDFSVPADLVSLLESPPSLAWERRLGPGHAAIVGNFEFGYSFHLDGEREIVQKWPLTTGDPVWQFDYGIGYHASFADYDGPHSTPLIDDDRLFTVSIDGQAHAIDVDRGEQIWRRDIKSDFRFKLPQSGYAASPLHVDGKIILPTVGRALPTESERFEHPPRDADPNEYPPGAVALDANSGETVWQTESFRSSHASPILAVIEDRPTLVFHGMFELVGVDPASGAILWRHLLRSIAADNVSFTPYWDRERGQILICHGYCERGVQAIEVNRTSRGWSTDRRWSNRQLRIVHTNAAVINELLIGTNRSPTTLLVGIDIRDGRTKFRQRGFGKSNLIGGEQRVLILDEGGDLVAGRVADGSFREAWRKSVLPADAWTVPTILGNQVLLRNGRQLKAYEFA